MCFVIIQTNLLHGPLLEDMDVSETMWELEIRRLCQSVERRQ